MKKYINIDDNRPLYKGKAQGNSTKTFELDEIIKVYEKLKMTNSYNYQYAKYEKYLRENPYCGICGNYITETNIKTFNGYCSNCEDRYENTEEWTSNDK